MARPSPPDPPPTLNAATVAIGRAGIRRVPRSLWRHAVSRLRPAHEVLGLRLATGRRAAGLAIARM